MEPAYSRASMSVFGLCCNIWKQIVVFHQKMKANDQAHDWQVGVVWGCIAAHSDVELWDQWSYGMDSLTT